MSNPTLRRALASDVPGIQRVRSSVLENKLVSLVISNEAVREAIEDTGRGWVIEVEGDLVGFAIGNVETGNIWALFVQPGFDRRGFGRLLHDAMVEWLWSKGLDRLWLTTDPGTRAAGFYESAGWNRAGLAENGELKFEMLRDEAPGQVSAPARRTPGN